MTDWKYYLVTSAETEEQIAARIINAAKLVPEAPFDCAVREIEAAQKEIERLQTMLAAANEDADKLAHGLEYFFSQNGAILADMYAPLIAHKNRVEQTNG